MPYAAAGLSLFLAGQALYKNLTKYNLRDKVILVTGGSRGLGLVLARQLGERGAKLAICARSIDQLKNAEQELTTKGYPVLSLPVDITSPEEVSEMVKEIIAHYGHIDVIINNAGTIQVGPAETMTLDDFEKAMRTNFWGALYTIYSALPHFLKRGQGRIVNISSIGGKIAFPHLLPYTASKFALTGLSEGLHAELKKKNIHVTTIIPNLMRTGSPMNVVVKGEHEDEYAWFKVSDSSPLLSQKVENAAASIIEALEQNESERILTATAKLSTGFMGLAPSVVTGILSLINEFLPESGADGMKPKKGYEAESTKSKGKISSISDEQAIKNNEL